MMYALYIVLLDYVIIASDCISNSDMIVLHLVISN